MMKDIIKQRHSTLKLLLTILFSITLVVSNIITSKQLQLPYGLVMPGAVILFPVTYILSDIFSEVYGYKWSRITSYIGIVCNLFAVLFFTISISLPTPIWFENAEAFKIVLGNTPRMLIASVAGLWFGDLVNDIVFKKMKQKYLHSHKNYGYRAIVSSIFGELGDSLLFAPIAFYGVMPIQTMVIMIFTQAGLKVAYELLFLPISQRVMKKVSDYEKDLDYVN